jgi:hypothetical protein
VHEGGQEPHLPAERQHQRAHPEAEADEGAVVQDPVERGRREVLGVAGQGRGVAGLLAVHLHVEQLHLDPAVQHGGVGVALDVGERVVLAVDGHPLAGADARRDPDQEAERLGGRTAQGEGAVGEGAVQVDRRGQVGEQGDAEADDDGEEHGAHLEHAISGLPTGR